MSTVNKSLSAKESKLFVASPYLHNVRKNDNFIVWHSLFGNPTIVNKGAFDYLSLFLTPTKLEDTLGSYKYKIMALELFDKFKKLKFVNPIGFDDRAFLEKKIDNRITKGLNGSFIDYLEIRVSESCNFNCSYCILQNATRIRDKAYKKIMDFATAKKSIDIYVDLLIKHSKKKAEITFGGAEPTINWDLIQKTIEYAKENYGDQIKFIFYINTNFSLLTDEKIAFIKLHKIRLSPSIDGQNSLSNDSTRVTKSGEGTFDTIMSVVRSLRRAGVDVPACSTTTNAENFQDINRGFIDWAKKEGFREVNINIDVMNFADIDSSYVADRLIDVVRYGSESNVGVSGFWKRPIEDISYSLLNHRTSFCGAVRGDNLVVDPLGDIYSCGYSNNIIGSIYTFDTYFEKSGVYHNFLKQYSPISQKHCHGCEIEGYCGGGCLITQEFNEENDKKIDQMCEIYKLMTRKLMMDLI
jgi:uncharacterized protein